MQGDMWQELDGKHKGETCLIIGNGPSLKDVPLEFLHKYPTFGTNRIYLMDGFEPTHYASVNPLVVEQSAENINKITSIKFITSNLAHLIDGALPLVSHHTPCFSMNPRAYIYEGYTVTYACLQLAYYMDFDTVLLVGVDHRFTFHGSPNEQVVATGPDPNHFHPEYFGVGVKWNNPDLARSESAYKIAEQVYTSNNKRIINLTKGTALDVFEKGQISDY